VEEMFAESAKNSPFKTKIQEILATDCPWLVDLLNL